MKDLPSPYRNGTYVEQYQLYLAAAIRGSNQFYLDCRRFYLACHRFALAIHWKRFAFGWESHEREGRYSLAHFDAIFGFPIARLGSDSAC